MQEGNDYTPDHENRVGASGPTCMTVPLIIKPTYPSKGEEDVLEYHTS